MSEGKRSTRGIAPLRFEAHDEEVPHDLMSARKKMSDKNLGKAKAKAATKKKISREHSKLSDTADEKEVKKKKETERKRKQRQKKKETESTIEDKAKEMLKERNRKRIYRAKKNERE